MRDSINWARLLAFVTGLVNQELLLQNEYLAAENRILRAHLAVPTPALRSGAVHTGRDRKTTWAQKTEAGGLHGQVGHHPGLVSAADCPQVRWFQMPRVPWPTPDRIRDGRAGGSLRSRELGLGLRPHRRRAGQPGPSPLGCNRGQHPAAPRHRVGTEQEANPNLE